MSCAMGFGELNIPSSRAFWDDCDEDELENKDTPVEMLQLDYGADNDKTPIAADLFVLVEGAKIAPFAHTTLLANTRTVCKIPAKMSSLHYNSAKNTLVAVVTEELTNSGEIVELLLPYAKAARLVVTLTVKSKVEYKSEHIKALRNEITFLRGINSKQPHVSELEAPNFITGVAAGIASWRHNGQLPVSAYVAYTDNVALDALAAQPILQLLQRLNVECASSYRPEYKESSLLYS